MSNILAAWCRFFMFRADGEERTAPQITSMGNQWGRSNLLLSSPPSFHFQLCLVPSQCINVMHTQYHIMWYMMVYIYIYIRIYIYVYIYIRIILYYQYMQIIHNIYIQYMNTYTYHLCLLNLSVCKPSGENSARQCLLLTRQELSCWRKQWNLPMGRLAAC